MNTFRRDAFNGRTQNLYHTSEDKISFFPGNFNFNFFIRQPACDKNHPPIGKMSQSHSLISQGGQTDFNSLRFGGHVFLFKQKCYILLINFGISRCRSSQSDQDPSVFHLYPKGCDRFGMNPFRQFSHLGEIARLRRRYFSLGSKVHRDRSG